VWNGGALGPGDEHGRPLRTGGIDTRHSTGAEHLTLRTVGLGPVDGDAASWLHSVFDLLKAHAYFGPIDRVREDVGPRGRLRHFGVERPVLAIRSWVVHFGEHRSHRTGTRSAKQLRLSRTLILAFGHRVPHGDPVV